MSVNEEKIKLLSKALKLSSFKDYQEIVRHAVGSNQGYEEFLLTLLERETSTRQDNKLTRLKRGAKFPYEKTIGEFDVKRLSYLEPSVVGELSTCEFIERKENVVMIGSPGTGKTHLSIALGLKACNSGYKVFFATAANLSNKLVEAQENRSLGRFLRQLARLDLLIIDELSYLSFNKHQSELLFQVISERSERGSIILSTNLAFSEWEEFFPDTMLTAALIDRVTFRGHILNMNGDSYRLLAK